MSEDDKGSLRKLYSGLKELDEEEYKLLWDKYYLSTGPVPISDAELAGKYGMKLNQYRKKRNDILNKLQKLIKYNEQPLNEKYLKGKEVMLNDIRTDVILDRIGFYKTKENTKE